MDILLETTNDGSHTFYVPQLNEHYHSTHGAVREAMHVFIKEGMLFCKKNPVRILEIGFGTGLNAFLTLIETEKQQVKVDFITTELFPLSSEYVKLLNYNEYSKSGNREQLLKIHSAPWNRKSAVTPNFSLLKLHTDITKDKFKNHQACFDLIYFDAFAPDKQPEMWSRSVFKKIYNLMSHGGILVTYSAKGAIRRLLQSIGFSVERIPGPPGKREMIRAIK